MNSEITAALIGIGFLILVNIAVVAFTYGKLNQKVDDFCQRVERLEKRINGK